MRKRAPKSGIRLTSADVAIAKGMLDRGDRQHDIAAWFGVNGGRIGEIATGYRFHWVEAAPAEDLPPPGPYPCGREAFETANALAAARHALVKAERVLRASLSSNS